MKSSEERKLLVVSHSCTTSINQQIHAELERTTDWKITLVIPENWRDEFGRTLNETPWQTFHGKIIKVPVWFNGNIVLHTYRLNWRKFLRLNAFDAIYINHEPYALATAQIVHANSKDRRVPIGFYSCQNIRKRYPLPFRNLERMVYQNSSFSFPITTDVANVLRAKGYQGETSICPLPFDPELYHPRAPMDWPVSLQRETTSPLIGYVGRLVEVKGLRTFAAALGKLRDLPWKLAIIGTGSFGEEFQSLLQAEGVLDRCLHFGFVPHEETPTYLSALDILVIPSETQPNWKEQFGRVIIEALASGAAVVGSDSGEIPNLIRSSGGGRVFPERNAEALAKELEALIADPKGRKQQAETGRQWATKNMALAPVAAKMAETIERAVHASQNS